MGVASARIDLKQAAGRAETMLERYAEPLMALHVEAESWPEPFLRLAWSKVIENSAHDSICGCSIDPVVAQVLVRFAEAEQIASTLARRTALAVSAAAPRGSMAVLNPTPAQRHGVIDVELLVPDEWTTVALELADGSLIGTQELSRKAPLLFDASLRGDEVDDLFRRFHGREIFDHAWNGFRIDGRTITLEVDDEADPAWLDVDELRSEVVGAMKAAPTETWRVQIVASPRRTLAASVPVPALGWTALRPVKGQAEIVDPVRADDNRLSNGLVTVEIGADGTLALSAADGTRATGAGRIVDGGDDGDSYNYGPPTRDTVVDVPRSVSVEPLLDGPVLGRLRVTREYDWPSGLEPGGAARLAATEPTTVRMEVELRAGEPFVRIGVAFDNRSDDHRVRFHAPLPRQAATSHAEGQFAVVERGLAGEGGYHEVPLATFPAHGWVDAGGLAILLDHVGEYEVTDDGREIALTLLRSTGLISRNANPYRQDPAGPEIAIPDAQMRGPWHIGFALFPHAGDWLAGVPAAAEAYRRRLLWAHGSAAADAPWPPPAAGAQAMELVGDAVTLSALRRRGDGWLEARVVNLASEPRRAILRGALTAARSASILGEPGGVLRVEGGAVTLDLGAAEIRTIQVRRAEPGSGRAEVLDATGPRQHA
jgi:alpha-mannosidase